MLTRIFSIVFLGVAIYLGYFLFNSIKSEIDEERRIKRVENQIIDKLKLIRDAEVAYQKVHGRYTDNWDSLISFLDSGTIYITEIREEIIPQEYGTEEVIRHVDTVGRQSAREFVFTELSLVTAGDTGVVININFDVGDKITKNLQLYNLRTPDRVYKVRSPFEGTVTRLYVKDGDRVVKGGNIAEITRYKYALDYDVTNLPYVPGTDKKFELFADEIERSGVPIDVFEAKDPDPINPERRKNNNEKALRVGSRTDVTIAGNWE